jgi:hypothetical protein
MAHTSNAGGFEYSYVRILGIFALNTVRFYKIFDSVFEAMGRAALCYTPCRCMNDRRMKDLKPHRNPFAHLVAFFFLFYFQKPGI